jgi:hypothetical protein
MGRKANELIWNTVDRCVYLEDDYLPAVSFFQYCAELLERYKDDLRIECICGTNLLEKWEKPNSDYFFSRQGSIWGCAYWKRCYDLRNFDYAKDEYVMGLLKQRTSRNKAVWKRINAYANSEFYEGHVAGGEFFHEFAMYGHNQLQIIPKYNLISNIGCTADGEHSDSLDQLPKGIRRAFNIKTYEINFPMKHPKYVIPDVEYEKKRNRLAAYNRPLIAFYRKLERLFRKILKGDFRYIINKIKAKRELEK